jgi:opacity protein-like surface antigen
MAVLRKAGVTGLAMALLLAASAQAQDNYWVMAAGSGTASIRADSDDGAVRVKGDGHSFYAGHAWSLTPRIDFITSANYARFQDVEKVNDSVVGAELGLRLQLPADGLPKPVYLTTSAGWHYADALERHGASLMAGVGVPVLVWQRASIDLQYQYRYYNWRERDGYYQLRSKLSQLMLGASFQF